MVSKEHDVTFKKSIGKDLGANPGLVEFKTLSSFHEWLDVEDALWIAVDAEISKRNRDFQHHRHLINSATEARKKLMFAGKGGVEQITSPSDIEGILKAYTDGRLVHSESTIGKQIEALAKASSSDAGKAKELSYFIVALGTDEVLINLGSGGQIDLNFLLNATASIGVFRELTKEGYATKINEALEQAQGKLNEVVGVSIDAIAEYKKAKQVLEGAEGIENRVNGLQTELGNKIDEAMASHLGKIETSLKNAVSDIRQMEEKYGAVIEEMKDNFNTTLNELSDGSEQKFESFVQSAQDSHDLKAVENFWGQKRSRHLKVLRSAGGLFIAGIAGTIWLMVAFGFKYLTLIGIFNEAHELVARDFNLPLGVFATLPVIGVFWILRQILKVFLTNMAQYSDADERIAMTNAYLALGDRGNLTKEDRILIMQALFRPGPGGGHDDGGGMPPNWFDILAKRMDPKS